MRKGFERIEGRLLALVARARLARRRVAYRFGGIVERMSRVLSVLAFVAAVATVTSLLLYFGFDHTAVNRSLLRTVISMSQAVFLLAITYNVTFRFRNYWSNTRVVKRVADMAMLLTLIPVLFPHTSATLSWLHFLLETLVGTNCRFI